MQKKMMILGAGPLQIPAIEKAKALGYQIISVDYDENAPGFALADVKLLVSTLDQEEVYRQALRYQPDVVITSTSDGPVRTAAYVNEKLGKKPDLSYESAQCATIKSKMRDRLKACGVPIPEYFAAEDFETFRKAAEALHGHCIVKPADNAGSRGVVLMEPEAWQDCDIRTRISGEGARMQGQPENAETRIEQRETYDRAIYRYCMENSRNGTVMVEEVMTGPEVSVEALVIGGEPHIITVTDKYITQPPYFVELAHCEPSILEAHTIEEIEAVAAQAIRAIGIENAPAHVEIKVTEDGPKIVELAARLGGDFITSRLVPLSTGIDLVGASVLLATGEKPDLTPKRKQGAAIHFIHAGQEGVLSKVVLPETGVGRPGVEEIALYKKLGETVSGTRSSNDRLGHVITTGATAEEAKALGEEILAQIRVEIVPMQD
ncbi:MAG: ATP-grasp domain-containing protein [Bacteroidales bacterium]|nr:ATP-grasp domain-containing protein [Bacteroidales bacterium]MCM1415509.1 ATP-grasp domain-containing protein [bacterium]MCM1424877.1 ATP-grasp domain-containing protein [bacterium]